MAWASSSRACRRRASSAAASARSSASRRRSSVSLRAVMSRVVVTASTNAPCSSSTGETVDSSHISRPPSTLVIR